MGSIRIGESSIAPTFTPSLNVQPAVPLISTRGSCANAAEPAKAATATIHVSLRITCIVSFFSAWLVPPWAPGGVVSVLLTSPRS